jgi:hypothetical protein
MPPHRACRVTISDVDGVAHHVDVQGTTLFEAAAAAVALFREQGWAARALTANAVLRVEVRLPPVVHDVPLKAIEQWLRSPTDGPRDQLVKRQLGRPR